MQRNNLAFYLRLSLILLAIAAVVAGLLSGVYVLTKDRIAENEAQTVRAAVQELFPQGEVSELSLDPLPDGVVGVYRIQSGQTLLGYCVETLSTGYGGEMRLMVAISPDKTVCGVRVISHGETQGIGSKATDSDGEYLSRFLGKTAKGVEGISGVSGATYSSAGVKAGVQKAMQILPLVFEEGTK